MGFVSKTEPLIKELENMAAEFGLCIYDCQRSGANRLIVFLSDSSLLKPKNGDSKSAESKQVTSEDCHRFCRRLIIWLSVEGNRFGFSAEPEVEVGSPGVFRNLRTIEHYEGAVGEQAKLVLEGSKELLDNIENLQPRDLELAKLCLGKSLKVELVAVQDAEPKSVEVKTTVKIDGRDQDIEFKIPLGLIKKANVEVEL